MLPGLYGQLLAIHWLIERLIDFSLIMKLVICLTEFLVQFYHLCSTYHFVAQDALFFCNVFFQFADRVLKREVHTLSVRSQMKENTQLFSVSVYNNLKRYL
jgi:hypothetical protein